jgi:hypothetical protein
MQNYQQKHKKILRKEEQEQQEQEQEEENVTNSMGNL